MKKRLRVLLVDDDEEEYILIREYFKSLTRLAERTTYELYWVATFDAGRKALEAGEHDVYLIDYRLGEHNGLDLLRLAAARELAAPVILLTGQGSYDIDMAAMQEGAADYLLKDQINAPLLERSIRYALERKATQNELERLVAERTEELEQANAGLRAEVQRRKEAEAILRESETKFRTLADTTSAAIFILQDGKICYANPAAEFVTGYPPQELLELEFSLLAHPTYRKALQAGGEPAAPRFELKILRKSGEERWVDVTGGTIIFQGRPAWVVTAFDITERDLAEQALRKAKAELEGRVADRTEELHQANIQLARAVTDARQRAEELDALYNATTALLTTLDLETLLGKILDAAQRAISTADSAALYLLEPGSGQLQFHSSSGSHDERIQKGPASRSSELASMIQTGQAFHVPDVLSGATNVGTRLTLISLAPEGMRSLLLAPLLADGEALGALLLSAARPRAFTESDLRLLEGFAATTTAAIQNATLYAEVQRLAITDSLTGQLNRRGFGDVGWRELERFQRYGRPLSAILLDIDRFKEINDTYGHTIGDQVLCFVATHCAHGLRQVDILGRIGGDEFAILLPETDLDTAAGVAERIRRSVAEGSIAGIQVSVTLGVTQALEEDASLESLLDRADAAFYTAKRKGSNCVAVHL